MKNRFYLLFFSVFFIFSFAANATSYVLTVKGSNSNFTFSDNSVVLNSSNPFAAFAGDSIVAIYPTITRDVINLNVKEGLPENSKLNVEVDNILGNRVINFDFLSGNITQINVSNLAKGIYFVAVRENNNIIAVQKIIKQ